MSIMVHSHGPSALTLLIYFEWMMSCIAEMNLGLSASRYCCCSWQKLKDFSTFQAPIRSPYANNLVQMLAAFMQDRRTILLAVVTVTIVSATLQTHPPSSVVAGALCECTIIQMPKLCIRLWNCPLAALWRVRHYLTLRHNIAFRWLTE